MKKLVLYLLQKPFIASLLLKPALRLNTWSYQLATLCAVTVSGGRHPKAEIIQYEKWFLDHISPNSTVLDIGSNTGHLVRTLAVKAKMVYGIEIESKHHQRSLNGKPSNVEFICADATSYDYSRIEKIDFITLSNVLEHITDRVNFLKKILSAASWKNEGSKMVLIRVPLLTRDWISVYKKMSSVEWRLDKTHETEYSESELTTELTAAGLKIIKSEIRFGEIFVVCMPI